MKYILLVLVVGWSMGLVAESLSSTVEFVVPASTFRIRLNAGGGFRGLAYSLDGGHSWFYAVLGEVRALWLGDDVMALNPVPADVEIVRRPAAPHHEFGYQTRHHFGVVRMDLRAVAVGPLPIGRVEKAAWNTFIPHNGEDYHVFSLQTERHQGTWLVRNRVAQSLKIHGTFGEVGGKIYPDQLDWSLASRPDGQKQVELGEPATLHETRDGRFLALYPSGLIAEVSEARNPREAYTIEQIWFEKAVTEVVIGLHRRADGKFVVQLAGCEKILSSPTRQASGS